MSVLLLEPVEEKAQHKPEKIKYKSYFDKLKKKTLNSLADLSQSLNHLYPLFPEHEQAWTYAARFRKDFF